MITSLQEHGINVDNSKDYEPAFKSKKTIFEAEKGEIGSMICNLFKTHLDTRKKGFKTETETE